VGGWVFFFFLFLVFLWGFGPWWWDVFWFGGGLGVGLVGGFGWGVWLVVCVFGGVGVGFFLGGVCWWGGWVWGVASPTGCVLTYVFSVVFFLLGFGVVSLTDVFFFSFSFERLADYVDAMAFEVIAFAGGRFVSLFFELDSAFRLVSF